MVLQPECDMIQIFNLLVSFKEQMQKNYTSVFTIITVNTFWIVSTKHTEHINKQTSFQSFH